jgi:hypothetical protein
MRTPRPSVGLDTHAAERRSSCASSGVEESNPCFQHDRAEQSRASLGWCRVGGAEWFGDGGVLKFKERPETQAMTILIYGPAISGGVPLLVENSPRSFR